MGRCGGSMARYGGSIVGCSGSKNLAGQWGDVVAQWEDVVAQWCAVNCRGSSQVYFSIFFILLGLAATGRYIDHLNVGQ